MNKKTDVEVNVHIIAHETCSGCSHPYRHGNSYPSGLLALAVVVTEDEGRVCIVYDDTNAPSQYIRGLFLSDGRATCYHTNGSIWYEALIILEIN